MEFGVLGSLAVWAEGRELPLGGAKHRALLAVLLLRRNELVPSATIVDALWGEQPPATAVKAVHGYVSRLRKRLGEAVVETRPGGYLLRVEPGALDSQRFEALLAQGRLSLADGGAEEAGRVLRKGLALWRGPPLADFQYQPFAHNEIGRLEELRLVALEQRLEADLALGRGPEVMGELEALVRDHPLRENLCRLLMLALYRAGRQADALAVYRDARARLVDELGLDPSPALQRLEKAILLQEPALDLPAAPFSAPATTATARSAPPARKVVTVVFCDVVADIENGKRIDPEALGLLNSRGFELASAVVERHGGTVERFLGNGVMAVFGVPDVREDDALRAVRTAVEIRDALPDMRMQVRIGVNTGEVLAGGPDETHGLVTGDPVTVGKRLEEEAAAGEVLIGEPTLALVCDAAEVEPVQPLKLEGKAGRIHAFRVLRVHEAPERVHRMRFVGRERELTVVRDVWERVRAEKRCELVTLVADAGVGKSRLAVEALASSEAHIVRGRCSPYGEGITYLPVVDVLKQLELLPADEVAAAAIRSLLGEADAVTSAEEIAWAFRKTLERAAADRPLVVVFDDIHWGESTFLDLVEHVALLASGVSILLLCMARPELLERRSSWPVTLALDPLGDEDVEELIPRGISGRQRVKIARAAGGNPLFIEEMVAFADEADGEVVVPPTLQALLAARLDGLEPGERSVLERGAVEGEIFHRGAVQVLAPDQTQVTPRLAALTRKRLIRLERTEHAGEDAFRFCHLLMRDAAYDALPKATRAELHERLATWAEENGAELAEVDELLGYHLERSYRYRTELRPLDDETRALGRRAAGRLAAAGRRAIARGDLAAAVIRLERALALGIGDPRERVRVQVELGNALGETGRIAEADDLLAESHVAAVGLDERGVAAQALLYRVTGRLADPEPDLEELQGVSEQAMEAFAELGDERGLALAGRLLGLVIGQQGRCAAGVAELERALVHADASDDPATRRRVIGTLADGLCNGPTPVGEAICRCEELLLSARDDRVLEAVIKRFLGQLYAMAARFDEALELVRQSSVVLDELNQLTMSSIHRVAAAYAKELAGDRAGVEQELTARWLWFSSGYRGIDRHAIGAAVRLARFYCDEGRWDDAERSLAFGRDVPLAANTQIAVIRLAVEARLAAHHGRLAEALTLAQRAVTAAEAWEDPDFRAGILTTLAEVQRACGQTAKANAADAAALDLYEQKGNIAAAARLRAAPHDVAISA